MLEAVNGQISVLDSPPETLISPLQQGATQALPSTFEEIRNLLSMPLSATGGSQAHSGEKTLQQITNTARSDESLPDSAQLPKQNDNSQGLAIPFYGNGEDLRHATVIEVNLPVAIPLPEMTPSLPSATDSLPLPRQNLAADHFGMDNARDTQQDTAQGFSESQNYPSLSILPVPESFIWSDPLPSSGGFGAYTDDTIAAKFRDGQPALPFDAKQYFVTNSAINSAKTEPLDDSPDLNDPLAGRVSNLPFGNSGELVQPGITKNTLTSANTLQVQAFAQEMGKWENEIASRESVVASAAGSAHNDKPEVAPNQGLNQQFLKAIGLSDAESRDVPSSTLAPFATQKTTKLEEQHTLSTSQPAPPLLQTGATRSEQTNANPVEAKLIVNSQVFSQNWNEEIGQRVAWLARQNLQQAELQLNPKHLGPIDVRIAIAQDQQVTVSFVTQHSSVKESIDAAIPKLKEMFAQQGMDLVNVDVSQDSDKHRAYHQSSAVAQRWNLANHQRVDDMYGQKDNHPIVRLIEAPAVGTIDYFI